MSITLAPFCDVLYPGQLDGWVIAYIDDRPAGYLDWCVANDEKDVLHIKMIEVFPEYRRQGVAQAMLDEAIRYQERPMKVALGMLTEEGARWWETVAAKYEQVAQTAILH